MGGWGSLFGQKWVLWTKMGAHGALFSAQNGCFGQRWALMGPPPLPRWWNFTLKYLPWQCWKLENCSKRIGCRLIDLGHRLKRHRASPKCTRIWPYIVPQEDLKLRALGLRLNGIGHRLNGIGICQKGLGRAPKKDCEKLKKSPTPH